MKNNEAGEFELVLGNKQLLSGFFVVVILFAVFFVMGYIVGRNSSPPSKIAAASDTSGSTGAAVSQTRPQASGTATAAQIPPEAAQGLPPAGDGTPRLTTQPAREPSTRAEKVAAPASPPVAEPVPVPGETYLQVMAVKQEEAEVVMRTLKAKGFPATLAPGLKGFTRVLVGPYTDTASIGKAKAALETAGFRPFVKR